MTTGPGHPVLARTGAGLLSGLSTGGVVAFLGVPYATVPDGAGAFAAAGPAPVHQGVRAAHRPGPSAAQPGSVRARLVLGGSPPAGDDCLVMNVWTPRPRAGAGLPVLVWIHGGGFTNGSGTVAALDGAHLARDAECVVVTVNYRLGAAGFAYHPDLPGSGNAGLYDQRAALRWVRDEITAFGGDPARVTLAGDSAGSMAAALHSVLPGSAGLFAQVALHSGVPQPVAPGAAALLTERLAGHLGVTVAGLTGVPAAELVRATADLGPAQRYGPVATGELGVPLEELRRAAPVVPLTVNTTADEGTFFLVDEDAPRPVSREEAVARLAAVLGGDGGGAYTRAEATLTGPRRRDPHWVLSAALTQAMFDGPADAWATAAALRGAPVWRTRHTRPTTRWDGWLGATHTADVPLVFGNHRAAELRALYDGDPGVDAAARELRAALRSFLHTGDPGAGRPRWTPGSP